jgi:hypothetical protein
MADSTHEKDNSPNDPVAETYDRPPTPDEPVADEKEVIGESSKYEEPAHDHESILEAKEEGSRLDRTKSYATDASVTTAATSRHPERDSKPWYKTSNPLRWGKIPPIPTERDVSPEYKAGFFSLLFFGWMSPIMTVRTFSLPLRLQDV